MLLLHLSKGKVGSQVLGSKVGKSGPGNEDVNYASIQRGPGNEDVNYASIQKASRMKDVIIASFKRQG